MTDGGQFFWGGEGGGGGGRGAVLHEGLMVKSCQGWGGGSTNAFSSNLKTVYNHEIFGNHEGIYT